MLQTSQHHHFLVNSGLSPWVDCCDPHGTQINKVKHHSVLPPQRCTIVRDKGWHAKWFRRETRAAPDCEQWSRRGRRDNRTYGRRWLAALGGKGSQVGNRCHSGPIHPATKIPPLLQTMAVSWLQPCGSTPSLSLTSPSNTSLQDNQPPRGNEFFYYSRPPTSLHRRGTRPLGYGGRLTARHGAPMTMTRGAIYLDVWRESDALSL